MSIQDGYYDDEHPGWGGSGHPCTRCGTTEYFNSVNRDNEPMCDDCLGKQQALEHKYSGYMGTYLPCSYCNSKEYFEHTDADGDPICDNCLGYCS